jgi:hypothetical protein
VSWWVGCEQESQAATVHCGCCRSLFVVPASYTFASASLTSGVLVQLSIPGGAEVASSRSAIYCVVVLAEVTTTPGEGGRSTEWPNPGWEQWKRRCEREGGGEESGEERQIRCGAVPEASKDNWGIVALQQAHGGNEGGMQHASGGIDRIW